MNRFVHLHLHSEYSILDSVNRIPAIVDRVAEYEMKSVALTDHGTMAGWVEFQKECKKKDIKPILGCLLADQEILTSTGIKKVQDINIEDFVLTHKGRFRKVLNVMSRPYSGTGYEISFSKSNRKLVLTEEHPILIRDSDESISWKKPGNINLGRSNLHGGLKSWNSYVCLPKLAEEYEKISILNYLDKSFRKSVGGGIEKSYEKHKTINTWPLLGPEIELNYEFGYLLGIYAAEGSLDKTNGIINGGIRFSINYSENQLADQISHILQQFALSTTVYKRQDKSLMEILTASLPLALLLEKMVGVGAKNKIVPVEVLSGTSEVKNGFLDGLLDGDGKNPYKEKNYTGKRDLKTSSESLAWGTRALLANKGFWSSVTYSIEQGNFPQGQVNKKYESYHLSYSPDRIFSRTLEDDHYIFSPIRDIKKIQLETIVYNFEVEEDNSYVSDFILHNCEAYQAIGSRFEKSGYYHLILLAANDEGRKNLMRLSYHAASEGFYRKPRIDKEVLRSLNSGIICLSACLASEVSAKILANDPDWISEEGKFEDTGTHLEAIEWYREVFGDRYFLELQLNTITHQNTVNAALIDAAKSMNIPLVFTNDCHYTKPHDCKLHEACFALRDNKLLSDPKRYRFSGEGYWIKTPAEIEWTIIEQVPVEKRELFMQAAENTQLVAERCNTEVPTGKFFFPAFPYTVSYEDDLKKKCEEGLKERGLDLDQRYKDRLAYELTMINQMGFAPYFLVVTDFVNWAKENDIPVGAGRGSGAGCLAAYTLKITEVDPVLYNLYFERFINPQRSGYINFKKIFRELSDSNEVKEVEELLKIIENQEKPCEKRINGPNNPENL